MPKSNLDWLGVASLWLGAGIMAIKAGGLPLMSGAPSFLAANWWNYIPILLVTLYVSMAIYRAIRSVPEPNIQERVNGGAKPAPAVAAPKAPTGPDFAMRAGQLSKWKPDTPFRDALQYFATYGGQRQYHDTTQKLVERLMHALYEGRVTAWGKEHPLDAELIQIKTRFWMNADPTLKTNYAFSKILNCGAYDVSMSMDEMRHVWPPKEP